MVMKLECKSRFNVGISPQKKKKKKKKKKAREFWKLFKMFPIQEKLNIIDEFSNFSIVTRLWQVKKIRLNYSISDHTPFGAFALFF